MNSYYYARYQDCPPMLWVWPNFKPSEIACKGDGSLLVVPEALNKLQMLRLRIGKPLMINSAYRSATHNKAIGGEPHSKHLLGIAFDIALYGHDRDALTQTAIDVGFKGIGQYNTFIHVDARDVEARWDKRTSAHKIGFSCADK